MKNQFRTILHSLKSPQNVGMMIRSHVASVGSELIITDHPWVFNIIVSGYSHGRY